MFKERQGCTLSPGKFSYTSACSCAIMLKSGTENDQIIIIFTLCTLVSRL